MLVTEFCLNTERLHLRAWREDDLDPFAGMCADPIVMQHFPSTLTRETSAKLVENCKTCFRQHGYFYAPIEVKVTGEFVGFAGLDYQEADPQYPFAPCVDIGWRLKRSAWGKGYAREAANEWLRFGFETIGLEEIVSFTPHTNILSQKVMRRIGMVRNPADDFKHSYLDPEHVLALHYLYRCSTSNWKSRQQI